ncbi:hypothetical protein LTR36_008856 [Oleoguttula mirabilis]|uniref:SHOCT domain-containing protein n=1 Tax=Oleoguttula mirabilis TaxID=1507867 RepID=A0AAV9J8R2_9PEZI|nr:hypothetical protein LTR36_008856 [Oleoguttula mirabilis]
MKPASATSAAPLLDSHSKRMADLSIAPTLAARLLAIKNEGRITREEYDLLAANLDANASTVTLPDNITIATIAHPSYSALEAISRVLNTAELLEQIILQLPPLVIINTAMRVCKGFNHAIEASPAIQRKIYRSPDRKMGEHTLLFEAGHGGAGLTATRSHILWVDGIAREALYVDVKPRVLLDALARYPTLRKTLLAQPPVQAVRFAVRDVSWDSEAPKVIWRKEGVTFGDLYAAMDNAKAAICAIYR